MLTAVTLGGFKSYRERERLPVAPLTVLIGANASGKSNLLEALQLLSWLAHGRRLGDLAHAIRQGELSIRGHMADLASDPNEALHLGCEIAPDLVLTMDLRIDDRGPRIVSERLESTQERSAFPYYTIDGAASPHGNEVLVAYNNFARGGIKPHIPCVDQQAIFTQLLTPARFDHVPSQNKIPAAAQSVASALSSVLFLDPRPPAMRGYSYLDEIELRGDGSNVSSVLKRVCADADRKAEVLSFVRALPEQDIEDIDFLHTPRNEVMIRLVESFGGKRTGRDAAVLSDGTLRALAVAAAVLSVPPETLVVIEEIDNGVHPSRAKLLMNLLEQYAHARSVQVLLTTHNPALLDAVPDHSLGDTVACYRDPTSGRSRLARLADLDEFAELVAQGSLGWLSESGTLDRYLKQRRTPDERAAAAQATLEFFRNIAK